MTGRKRIGFRAGMRKLRGQRSIYNHSIRVLSPCLSLLLLTGVHVSGLWEETPRMLVPERLVNAPDADVSPLHYVIRVKWTLPTLRNVF